MMVKTFAFEIFQLHSFSHCQHLCMQLIRDDQASISSNYFFKFKHEQLKSDKQKWVHFFIHFFSFYNSAPTLFIISSLIFCTTQIYAQLECQRKYLVL